MTSLALYTCESIERRGEGAQIALPLGCDFLVSALQGIAGLVQYICEHDLRQAEVAVGTLVIARIPQQALERCVEVAELSGDTQAHGHQADELEQQL